MREPTERLIEHYNQHGYPQDIAGPLAEGEIRRDIGTFVRNRIAELTQVDPYYLDEMKKMELRVVGSMANQLGIRSRIPLEDIPLTKEESTFLKDIEESSLPENAEEFEKYLRQYILPKKEALSQKVRMRVMRAIMSRYMSDAGIFFKILTSPIVQNYLTGNEYRSMAKYTSPEMRWQILVRLKENKNKAVLPQEIGMMLLQDAIHIEDERSVMMFFDLYPNVDTINRILSVTAEKRNTFIVKMISQFIPRLSLEENRKVHWRSVFEKITEPSEYFVPLAKSIPEDLNVADAWNAIIDATIAQGNERYIQWIRSIVPPYGLSSATFAKLMRAAHEE